MSLLYSPWRKRTLRSAHVSVYHLASMSFVDLFRILIIIYMFICLSNAGITGVIVITNVMPSID